MARIGRRAVTSTAINDFITLEKDTPVWISLTVVHKQRASFGRPGKFLPARFEENQNELIHDPTTFMPFGLGSRRCPAEDFSMKLMNDTLLAFVKNFELQPCAETEPSLYDNAQIVRIPKSFTFRLKKRNTESV